MRKFSEEKCSKLGKEKSELVTQLDENEEELQEVIRKYKTSVNTISQDQLTIQKQTSQIQELELGSKKLKEQLTELSRKLEDMNQGSEESSEKTTADVQKLELRVKDLETKLELEKTTKGRMESHIKRQTDVIESLQRDLEEVANKEKNGQEEQKKLKVSIRSLKEELSNIQNKEKETILKKSEAEKQLEVVEAEKIAVKNQLKLAQTRIEGLQSALKSGDSDDEEEMTTFLDHHRYRVSNINRYIGSLNDVQESHECPERAESHPGSEYRARAESHQHDPGPPGPPGQREPGVQAGGGEGHQERVQGDQGQCGQGVRGRHQRLPLNTGGDERTRHSHTTECYQGKVRHFVISVKSVTQLYTILEHLRASLRWINLRR